MNTVFIWTFFAVFGIIIAAREALFFIVCRIITTNLTNLTKTVGDYFIPSNRTVTITVTVKLIICLFPENPSLQMILIIIISLLLIIRK